MTGVPRLAEEVVRICPECGAEIVLEAGTMDSELMPCPGCGFCLEVTFFDPGNPEEVAELRKRAATQGQKKEGPPYNVSLLDFSASPAIIPEPRTEEDHGE